MEAVQCSRRRGEGGGGGKDMQRLVRGVCKAMQQRRW